MSGETHGQTPEEQLDNSITDLRILSVGYYKDASSVTARNPNAMIVRGLALISCQLATLTDLLNK